MLEQFITEKIQEAIAIQRELHEDIVLIEEIENGNVDEASLRRWMTEYGLFQGIGRQTRSDIVSALLENNAHIHGTLDDQLFITIYGIMYECSPRGWLSASSKISWLHRPNTAVIYDSFVERSLIVLRKFEPALFGEDPLGRKPTNNETIEEILEYYNRYQHYIRLINATYGNMITDLIDGAYPYPIRILDKLLWILGNPDT